MNPVCGIQMRYRKDRDWQLSKHAFRDGPKNHPLEIASAVRTHHDQIDLPVANNAEDLVAYHS